MNNFRKLLAAAGFSNISLNQALLLIFAVSFALAMLAMITTEVLGFAIAIFALSIMASIELLKLLRSRRNRVLLELWPGVFETMESGYRAGLTVSEQVSDLATLGPKLLKSSFQGFNQRIMAGWSVDDAAIWFQSEFDNRYVDQFVMLVRLGEIYGLTRVSESWALLAKEARSDIRSESAIESKHTWLMAMAKISVLAPWLVSLILIQRPEGKISYQSSTGLGLMLLALLISLGAYLLTERLGRQNKIPRVFYATV